MANRMVRVFGMSNNLVPMSYDQHNDNIFIGREMTQAREYSEDTARKIDAEVTALITESYKRAQDILKDNIEILHALSDLLIEKETVMGKELDELVKSMKPDFVFPKRDEVKDEEPEVSVDTEAQRKASPTKEDKSEENKIDLDIDSEDDSNKDDKP
jgi:cell division protease FtsH